MSTVTLDEWEADAAAKCIRSILQYSKGTQQCPYEHRRKLEDLASKLEDLAQAIRVESMTKDLDN